MNYCQLCLIEARIREEKRQKRAERTKWIMAYIGLFLLMEVIAWLWIKGVIG